MDPNKKSLTRDEEYSLYNACVKLTRYIAMLDPHFRITLSKYTSADILFNEIKAALDSNNT